MRLEKQREVRAPAPDRDKTKTRQDKTRQDTQAGNQADRASLNVLFIECAHVWAHMWAYAWHRQTETARDREAFIQHHLTII